MDILNTGIKNAKNVQRYIFGAGTLTMLPELLKDRRKTSGGPAVFFIDHYYGNRPDIVDRLEISPRDAVLYVDTRHEPTTEYIDRLVGDLKNSGKHEPCAIVGMGGGVTMDVAKAVANLMTNGGRAEDYQGWDLVKVPGVYKIAVPTLSGTGAEATRTCVMTNKRTGLKLGMNSDYTVYDQVIMDPQLTRTVPRDQYFWTGMDAYVHCVESLNGRYRNAIGDAYSAQTIGLCRDVFLSEDMMADDKREKLMVASYLGGCAIATSYVGVVHPFSAGLSVVLGLHHCVANCIVMRAMKEFYPAAYDEFWSMAERQRVDIPSGVCRRLSDAQYEQLYRSTVVHEKPLTNALGDRFREVLTREKVIDVFRSM